MSTKRVRLTVAYDGTDFRGWAAQAGQRTVQGTLTEAVRRVSREEIEITGASRTDSGAHAWGQVCHFDSEVGIEPEKWPRVLNKVLPPDLRVREAAQVDESFHSRFSAESRHYRYSILLDGTDPFRGRCAHCYPRPLTLDRMQEAARHLEGDHDFLAFTEELDPHVENTRRTLYSVRVRWNTPLVEDEIEIDVVGTAFLRGMMRRISGALLEVGRGKRPVDEVMRLLTPQRDTLQWPVVLPARGLTLMQVEYSDPPRDHREQLPIWPRPLS